MSKNKGRGISEECLECLDREQCDEVAKAIQETIRRLDEMYFQQAGTQLTLNYHQRRKLN